MISYQIILKPMYTVPAICPQPRKTNHFGVPVI